MALVLAYRGGTYGTPTDLTSPYGGPINMSATLNGSSLNILFQPLAIPTSSNINYYSAFYRSLESSNTISSARFYNRAGAIVNSSSGVFSVVSTSSSDVGVMCVTGLIGGVPAQDFVTLTGTTTAFGSKIFDTGSVTRWEYLAAASPATSATAPLIPSGNIACYVNAAQCALMYGSYNNILNGGCQLCSAEFMFALAVSKNNPIAGANVLTAPATGIGSPASVAVGTFSNATVWAGNDQSLTIPTGGMVDTDYIAIAIQFTAYQNTYPTKGGTILSIGDITGTYT